MGYKTNYELDVAQQHFEEVHDAFEEVTDGWLRGSHFNELCNGVYGWKWYQWEDDLKKLVKKSRTCDLCFMALEKNTQIFGKLMQLVAK